MAMVARELAALDADVIMLHPGETPDRPVRVRVGAGAGSGLRGGVRSVVTAFDTAVDRGRLNVIRWCRVQFQERVGGPDVRVPVVGAEVYAARSESTAVDYRYARMQVGADARLGSCRLDDDVA